jgi:hypothetical protein
MGARKILVIGVTLILIGILSGCAAGDPPQVRRISSDVKELDLKTMGGVLCDAEYRPPPGGTVTYSRNLAVRGAGEVPELVSRFKALGYWVDVEDTEYSKQYTYLYGPHQIAVTLGSKPGTTRGDKFYLDDTHLCVMPADGVTLITIGPRGG